MIPEELQTWPVRDVAVLGCGGFIGSHLVEGLLRNTGLRIHGWDLSAEKLGGWLGHPRFFFHRRDIDDDPSLPGILEGCDAVISLAAVCTPALYNSQPLRVIDSNFLSAQRVVEHCSRSGVWLIHFSTSEVYGKTLAGEVRTARAQRQNPGLTAQPARGPGAGFAGSGTRGLIKAGWAAPEGGWVSPATGVDRAPGDTQDEALYLLREDSSPLVMGPVHRQRWSYACAKQLLERTIVAHGTEHRLPYTIIRPFNFFGPRMDYLPGRDGEGIPRVLACFARALLEGEALPLVDGGWARRTFLYIDDAVEALRAVLCRREAAAGQIFNLGHPANEVRIRDLAIRMRRIFLNLLAKNGGRPRWPDGRGYFDPGSVLVSALDYYGEGYEDSDRRLPDVGKAEKLLGWRPRTPLDEGLEVSLRFYLNHYGMGRGPGMEKRGEAAAAGA